MPNGPPNRVTGGEAANDEPALSPDGQWLAFHSTRPPAGIYLQPAAGGAARLLVGGGWVPRFSPDGKWIAYLKTGENVGDVMGAHMSMLSRMPAHGGEPLRLARNASSVQGAAWSDDSRSVLFLTVSELSELRLWSAPVDGAPAAQIPEFSYAVHLGARACAVTGDRFLYMASDGETALLTEFLLKPTLRAKLEHAGQSVQFPPDGASFLLFTPGKAGCLQDYRTGARKPLPETQGLSSDGLFVLHVRERPAGTKLPIFEVLSLKTGESWGRMQTGGVLWDLSRGGQWLLAASTQVHRTIVAWDTRTAEHQPIYSHPSANLYLANFSKDGRWALFTSQEVGRQPRMWAASFRGLHNVPATEWVDLGAGDYPRWSPAGGRIYFTQIHDGFECIFTRAVDPATKRPAGPVTEVQHFHGRLTPQGLSPGTFRLSVAQDKLAFSLGERAHRLFEWR